MESQLKIPKIQISLTNPAEGLHISFEDLTILLKENNKFKLHLKESFLIKRNKSEFTKLLEFFD